MSNEYLEHINATVKDLDLALHFLLTAMPSWRVRGRGKVDWFGKPIEWLHIGLANPLNGCMSVPITPISHYKAAAKEMA